jgi:hypothetical protein
MNSRLEAQNLRPTHRYLTTDAGAGTKLMTRPEHR